MTDARLIDVPLTAIRLAPANPRTDGAHGIDGLAASLDAGLAQRPTLVEVETGVYEVLTGERRVRAGLARGWQTMPVVVEGQLTPVAAHARRVVENLHRADLGPLDEARALKLDWLNANAVALGLGEQADKALAEAGTVRASLAAITALLVDAGWSPTHPTLTQETYLTQRGLALSKAMLRKKLQVLNLSPAAEARLDQAGLSEAGIRAFVRLDHADQTLLLDAIADDPTLVKETRTIVGWVRDPVKRRTMAQAIAIARGEVVPFETELPREGDRSTDQHPAFAREQAQGTDDVEDAHTPVAASSAPSHHSPPLRDEAAAAELVMLLMESAQLVVSQPEALRDVNLDHLPAPWDLFARESLATLITALQPFA